LQQFRDEFLFIPHVIFQSMAQCRAWYFLRARFIVARWFSIKLYHSRDGAVTSDTVTGKSEMEQVRTTLSKVLAKRRGSPSHHPEQADTEGDAAGSSSTATYALEMRRPRSRTAPTPVTDTRMEDNEDTGATSNGQQLDDHDESLSASPRGRTRRSRSHTARMPEADSSGGDRSVGESGGGPAVVAAHMPSGAATNEPAVLPSFVSAWECARCTFLNDMGSAVCAMCDHPRQNT